MIVITIIMILAGLLLPALMKSKSMAIERTCMSNMHQIHLALAGYSGDNRGYYPLEPTESNGHLGLIGALEASSNGLRESFYCPRSNMMEEYARETVRYPATGDSTSVVNTDANWKAGNISYNYWSFEMPKMFGGATWVAINKESFWPRTLRGDKIKKSSCYAYPAANFDYDAKKNVILPYPDLPPSQRWILTDFFRQGAPFPHMYRQATGLTVACLDGHAEMSYGWPQDNFR